jgi:hypothetical protein
LSFPCFPDVLTGDEPVSLEVDDGRLVGTTIPVGPRRILRLSEQTFDARCPVHGYGENDEARSTPVHNAERFVISHPMDSDQLRESTVAHRDCWQHFEPPSPTSSGAEQAIGSASP